jgi:AcrR family transcriptional regulator
MKAKTDNHLRSKGSETTGKGHERAYAILQIARTLLASEGYAGLSMRNVAARAGVNLSTVQHYYPSKDALLEALLLQTLQEYQAAVDQQLSDGAGGEPLKQFEAIVDYFLEDLANPQTTSLLCELWALANRNAFAAKILDNMLTRSRKVFRNLVRALAPELPAAQGELRGALIVAQLQGLMLYLASSRPRHADLAGLKQAARRALVQLATAH